MHKVRTVMNSKGDFSEVITKNHFGSNMLFQSDRLDHDSDFREVFEKSGANFIRYPGGTVSEEYFDLSNSNSNSQKNVLDELFGYKTVREREVTPLSDFLEYSKEIGGTPVIVLPTYRYFNGKNGKIGNGAEEEVRGFIRALLSGEHGPADQVVLEIGNEWYQPRFDWNVGQFGRLQAELASLIDSEARLLGMRNDVSILVQSGRTEENNKVLTSFFDEGNKSTVDGVITHAYGTNSSGDPLGIGGGIGRRLEQIDDMWSSALGKEIELAVTEWNVGESGESTTAINGTMRLAPLMRMFSEMISNGVDLASIWSTQTRGPAGLTTTHNGDDNFTPTGYLFSLLSDRLEGKRLVNPDEEPWLKNSSGEKVGYNYVFQEKNESTVIFVSGVNEEISLSADISQYASGDAYVFASKIIGAPGQICTKYWSDASISYETNLDLSSGGSDFRFNYTLDPYEFVAVHIVKGKGVTIDADNQNAISDKLVGTGYSDNLNGNLGDDIILGGFGHDILEGGSGVDYLDGGYGHDKINGGEGNDELVGGKGNDNLAGGIGDDILRPGNGGGKADGGDGIDTMSFKDAGVGVIIHSPDGKAEVGSFSLRFSGIEIVHGSSWSDKFFGGSGGDTFFAAEGNDRLFGGAGNDFLKGGLGQDYLEGGDGADILVSGSGNDTLIGGNGDDLLRVGNGGGRVDGGEGTDTLSFMDAGVGVTIHSPDGMAEVGSFSLGFSGIEIVHGSSLSDKFIGGNGGDVFFAEEGNDYLFGGTGDDFLEGGLGQDYLEGGDGADTLVGGSGNDTLIGGQGDDLLRVGNGGGRVEGGEGTDTLSFEDASDGVSIWTNSGVVEVGLKNLEFEGVEIVRGSDYSDTFEISSEGGDYLGQDGDDFFFIQGGEDWVADGGGGNDSFLVSNGNGQVFGGSGNDFFYLHGGSSKIDGGSGNDTFVLVCDETDVIVFREGGEQDNISGFTSGSDIIELHGMSRDKLSIIQEEQGTLLDFGNDDSIYLFGVHDFDANSDLVFL